MSSASAAAVGAEDDRRHLIGLIPCLAFAVGTMVGGGVFTLSGEAINRAGPAAILSYLIAGAVMFVSALSFVAVATRAREGDTGYGPVAEILSPVWRFVVMWGFYLNGLTLLTFLLVSFGDYLHQYFFEGMGQTLAALLAITAVGALNLGPADVVGKAETYVVAVKILLLLVFVSWGLADLAGTSFKPFAPHGTRSVIEVSALLFTTYTGFNVVTNMAGSVRRPERTVPLAVMGSILISALLYVGVALAMIASGVKHFGSAGVGEAAQALMGTGGAYLIAFAACLSTLSGANANLLGASEVMLRLVAQGDVPPAAGRTTRGGHPLVSVAFVAVVAAVLVIVADVDNIVALANVAALIAMIVVNVAAFRLARQGWPGKGMRLAGGVSVPVVGTIACLAQFPSLGLRSDAVGVALMLSGMLLYASRHQTRFGEHVVDAVKLALHRLETPLARALRMSLPHRHHKPRHMEGTS